MDLVRFELTTSSMPFKKYQSLTGFFTRNKRLSTRPRGLRWTPRGGFWASGLHADSGTPRTGWHVACFPARAVAGWSDCRLPKETTIDFLIRMVPMWSCWRGSWFASPQRLGACRPAGGVAGSILTSVPASSVCAGHGSRSKISPVPARPPTQIPSAVSKTSRTLHVRSLHSGGTIFYRRG